jgi:Na+/H+-dicarboxylate symporter
MFGMGAIVLPGEPRGDPDMLWDAGSGFALSGLRPRCAFNTPGDNEEQRMASISGVRRKFPAAAWILIAMVIGIILGYMIFASFPDKKTAAQIAGYVSIMSDVFLRLIKMLIGPLVFSTLVVGIAHMGDAKSVGRVFGKALGWFITASLVSLVLGLIMANLLQPGKDLGLPLPDIGASANLAHRQVHAQGLRQPPRAEVVRRGDGQQRDPADRRLLDVLRRGAGLARREGQDAGRGDRRARQRDAEDHRLCHEAGAARGDGSDGATVAVNGLEILLKFAVFMGDFYIGLILLWALLVGAGFVFLGPRVFKLLVLIKEAFLLSFATASSEAAYPKILDALDRFGVKRKISSFVMPMGYSFNLDGSMMYCTFAVLFIAQAYDIVLPIGTQVTMLLILMLTSKGMAGVPRASLVVIAATLNQFSIPEAGLLLILGVDTFLDMGRSATNAVGNSIATAVVAKWERRAAARGRGRRQRARTRRGRGHAPARDMNAPDLARRRRGVLAALLLAPALHSASPRATRPSSPARSPRCAPAAPSSSAIASRRSRSPTSRRAASRSATPSTCASWWSRRSARKSAARSRSAGSR